MKRLIALLVLAAVALAPAVAQGKSRAKVYRGTFQLVGADGDYVTGRFGHAHLVDGRRNDKLSVHVRRLAPRTKYVFRLLQAPAGAEACEEGAPGGTEVAGWRYRHRGVLKTNRRGVANGKARSHRFRAKRDVEYFVGVYSLTADREPGELVLCAELERRGGKSHGKKDDDKGHGHAKSRDDDKSRGKAEGHDDDKARGRSEEAPRGRAEGHDDDKARGRSDEAPRGRAEGHDKDRGHSGENGNGRGNGNGRDKGRG
jgi:hypothetical protein